MSMRVKVYIGFNLRHWWLVTSTFCHGKFLALSVWDLHVGTNIIC